MEPGSNASLKNITKAEREKAKRKKAQREKAKLYRELKQRSKDSREGKVERLGRVKSVSIGRLVTAAVGAEHAPIIQLGLTHGVDFRDPEFRRWLRQDTMGKLTQIDPAALFPAGIVASFQECVVHWLNTVLPEHLDHQSHRYERLLTFKRVAIGEPERAEGMSDEDFDARCRTAELVDTWARRVEFARLETFRQNWATYRADALADVPQLVALVCTKVREIFKLETDAAVMNLVAGIFIRGWARFCKSVDPAIDLSGLSFVGDAMYGYHYGDVLGVLGMVSFILDMRADMLCGVQSEFVPSGTMRDIIPYPNQSRMAYVGQFFFLTLARRCTPLAREGQDDDDAEDVDAEVYELRSQANLMLFRVLRAKMMLVSVHWYRQVKAAQQTVFPARFNDYVRGVFMMSGGHTDAFGAARRIGSNQPIDGPDYRGSFCPQRAAPVEVQGLPNNADEARVMSSIYTIVQSPTLRDVLTIATSIPNDREPAPKKVSPATCRRFLRCEKTPSEILVRCDPSAEQPQVTLLGPRHTMANHPEAFQPVKLSVTFAFPKHADARCTLDDPAGHVLSLDAYLPAGQNISLGVVTEALGAALRVPMGHEFWTDSRPASIRQPYETYTTMPLEMIPPTEIPGAIAEVTDHYLNGNWRANGAFTVEHLTRYADSLTHGEMTANGLPVPADRQAFPLVPGSHLHLSVVHPDMSLRFPFLESASRRVKCAMNLLNGPFYLRVSDHGDRPWAKDFLDGEVGPDRKYMEVADRAQLRKLLAGVYEDMTRDGYEAALAHYRTAALTACPNYRNHLFYNIPDGVPLSLQEALRIKQELWKSLEYKLCELMLAFLLQQKFDHDIRQVDFDAAGDIPEQPPVNSKRVCLIVQQLMELAILIADLLDRHDEAKGMRFQPLLSCFDLVKLYEVGKKKRGEKRKTAMKAPKRFLQPVPPATQEKVRQIYQTDLGAVLFGSDYDDAEQESPCGQATTTEVTATPATTFTPMEIDDAEQESPCGQASEACPRKGRQSRPKDKPEDLVNEKGVALWNVSSDDES